MGGRRRDLEGRFGQHAAVNVTSTLLDRCLSSAVYGSKGEDDSERPWPIVVWGEWVVVVSGNKMAGHIFFA